MSTTLNLVPSNDTWLSDRLELVPVFYRPDRGDLKHKPFLLEVTTRAHSPFDPLEQYKFVQGLHWVGMDVGYFD
jgi:hypothetical protein